MTCAKVESVQLARRLNCAFINTNQKKEQKMKAIIKLCNKTYKVFINDELKVDYSTLQEAQAYVASIDLNRPSVLRCKAFYQNTSKLRD